MSTVIHKTFGVNKKKGLMGFQFNYPYDGCVFDITRQAFAEYKRGLSDNDLDKSFKLQGMFLPVWQDIKSWIVNY